MAETLVDEEIEQDIGNTPKARLEKFLRENNVKVFTAEDFDLPKDEKSQAKIRAEVDEFLRIREERREEDGKLSEEREKSRQ